MVNYMRAGYDGNEDEGFDEEGEDALDALEDQESEVYCCPNCNSFNFVFGLVFLYEKLTQVVSCLDCGYISDPQYDEWCIAR